MYTFLLSKFELERELPQTTDQSKVVNFVSRLWYRLQSTWPYECFEAFVASSGPQP